MKIRNLFLFLFIAATVQALWAGDPKISEYKLDNGLTVILCEKHEIPTIFGGVVARVGSKDDPADATGLAHYMEHMLFKGTPELGTTDWENEAPYIDSIFALYDSLATKTLQADRESIQRHINSLSVKAGKYAIPNEFDNLLSGIGSTGVNAGTASDWTVYYNEFPPAQVQKWLEIYSHRFNEPVFRLFQSELETVYEEKNMYSDIFFYPMLEEFNRNLYKVHPYGQQTQLGTMESLKNPSLSRMKAFYEKWYVPGNMSLVLIGDFSTEAVKPLIEKTFGSWEAREVPAHGTWDEKPLEGREFVEVSMSPVKMELLGFKTIPSDDPDAVIMDVCNYLISNEGKTGLIDKLVLGNKLLEAQMLTLPYNDLLSTIIFVVPKLVGQSLDDAEQLAMGELRKLGSGNFSDALLEIAKLELSRDYKLEIEDNQNLGIRILENWYKNNPAGKVFSYPDEVNAVTREDIIRFAANYYGSDYLAFHSKMGFPDKEKIDKPGYDPIESDRNQESQFAKYLKTVPDVVPASRFVDFGKDIVISELTTGNKLYVVNNPENDIFSLKVRYGVGTTQQPLLSQSASLMNYAVVEGMSLDSVKTAFAQLGCKYNFSADPSYTVVSLTGPDKSFAGAIKLLGTLLTQPVVDQSRMEKIVEETEAERKMENSDADGVADALIEYTVFGGRSIFLNRPSLKELKKTTSDELVNIFAGATKYEAGVHYCGNLSMDKVSELLQSNYHWHADPVTSLAPAVRDAKYYSSTNLIIVDKPKAAQSKIYFYINGKEYSRSEKAAYDAFNFYFGGGFSGIVLQEIRESRSLAYSAGARWKLPPREDLNSLFYGYVGTQDDKTVEAVRVFIGLIREMPVKEERLEFVRNYLTQASLSSRPPFRNISENVVAWQTLGYTSDPNEALSKEFAGMDFSLITNLYDRVVNNETITICIVGDKKRMDTKSLAAFGKIQYLKEKSLYRK
jgi:predicted Zn-dependent peptidase